MFIQNPELHNSMPAGLPNGMKHSMEPQHLGVVK